MPASPHHEGIVVLGMPRSGTTLVRRLLDAHPSLHCPAETFLFHAAARFLNEEPIAGGLSVGVRSAMSLLGESDEAVLGPLRRMIFDQLARLAAKAGKPRWAEKTAYNSFHIDAIEALCGGRCRYLIVYRGVLDIVSSLRDLVTKQQRYPDELHLYVRRHPQWTEAFAHAWVDVNERLLRLAAEQPDRCATLQYERLVADPVTELARVLDDLHEPADTEPLVNRAMSVTANVGFGDWKTYSTREIRGNAIDRSAELTPQTVAMIAGIADQTMHRIGYNPLPVDHEAVANAERRFQLGMMLSQMRLDPPQEHPE